MRREVSVIIGCLCVACGIASAATTFTGVGNWNDPNLWSAGVPTGAVQADIAGPNTVCTLNTPTGDWGAAQRMTLDGGATLLIQDGAELTGAGWMRFGVSGVGTVIQTGGRVVVPNERLAVGDKVGGNGHYTISAGTITFTGGDRGDLGVGSREGSGTFTVVGTAPVIEMSDLIVSDRAGAAGTVEFKIAANGVSPINLTDVAKIDALGDQTTSALLVEAIEAPPIRDILLVNTTSANAVIGAFDTVNGNPAAEGAEVVLSAAGRTCTYTLTYVGGTGNDIVLVYQSAKTLVTSMIGDFEDGLGAWDNTWEAKSVLSTGTTGVTSGKSSLVITPVTGFSWALRYNCPAPIDLAQYKTLSVDVTWVAEEWVGSDMWIQFSLMAINSDGKSGWQQSGPSDAVNAAYPGGWDPINWGTQTRTLTWDLSKYDATGATWMQLVFSTNMGNVTTPGNYYIDNVKLIGGEVAGASSVETFDVARNYLTEGAGTFDGILNANEITALDAATSRPGALYFAAEPNAQWGPGPGPMIYRLIKGDFTATVKVTDFAGTLASIVEHNDGGILARDPNGAVAENWVSVNYFPTWTAFIVRNTIAGDRKELAQPAGTWTGADTFALAAQYPYLQLERKGSDFYFRISADGVTFLPLTVETFVGIYDGTQTPLVISRPELPATLQVGLMQCTYAPNAGYAAFDNFSIATP